MKRLRGRMWIVERWINEEADSLKRTRTLHAKLLVSLLV
jgi:hypothetical protein